MTPVGEQGADIARDKPTYPALLGLDAASRAIAAISLHQAFPNSAHYERFWHTSAEVAALSGWDRKAPPADAAYVALAADMTKVADSEAMGALARRLNTEIPGYRSLVAKTARAMPLKGDSDAALETLQAMRERHPRHHAVLEQLQRHLCSMSSRLGCNLEFAPEQKDQVNRHKYLVKSSDATVMEVVFCAHGPLSKSLSTVRTPQSIGQFNRFLEKLALQLSTPMNGVITDTLRIMCVSNESTFTIDSYGDEMESTLVLESSKLRQRFEFIIHPA